MNDILFFLIKMFKDIFTPKKLIFTLILGALVIIFISVLTGVLFIWFKPKPVIEILIILLMTTVLSPLILLAIAKLINKIS